jgi:hypothetical protein
MRQGVSEAANTTHPMNIRPCKLSNSDIADQVRIDTKERDGMPLAVTLRVLYIARQLPFLLRARPYITLAFPGPSYILAFGRTRSKCHFVSE